MHILYIYYIYIHTRIKDHHGWFKSPLYIYIYIYIYISYIIYHPSIHPPGRYPQACHAGPIVQLMQQRSSFPLSRLQDPWGPLGDCWFSAYLHTQLLPTR